MKSNVQQIYTTEPTSQVETITPSVAAEMMLHNTNNRPLNKRHVNLLANEMAAGQWVVTSSGIGVCKDHTILDGQHRLQAVIVSGATIRTLVCRGLHPKAQDVIDRGMKARTAGDVFYMHGCKNANVVAAGIIVINMLSGQGVFRRKKDAMWQEQYNDYYAALPSIQSWADRAVTYNQRIIPHSLSCGLGTVFELAEQHQGQAKLFMDSLQSGANLAEGSPALALRNRMIKNNYSKLHRLSQHSVGWLTIKAWNLHVRNKQGIKSLRLRSSESLPMVLGLDATTLPYYED